MVFTENGGTKCHHSIFCKILISIYFLSVLSVFIMIERKLKDRLLYILGLFAMFACLDELIGVFLTKIISELVYKSILECVGSIVILTSIFIFQRIKITPPRSQPGLLPCRRSPKASGRRGSR